MLMRYHWGLAVGHVYAHREKSTHMGVVWRHAGDEGHCDEMAQQLNPSTGEVHSGEHEGGHKDCMGADPHVSAEIRENRGGHQSESGYNGPSQVSGLEEDYESGDTEESDEDSTDCSETALLDFDEMYGDMALEEYED